ncbi:MAG: GNAT family N-acetyltransferase [Eubacteriales bacterium]|nr:GNAT family N-acetyltransferase [Eubacteriales bacterium]MDD3881808.1 GNAT family N-acetyltransferase [Eubacteriales bacterium]MDD4513569.1 GNAT family N-acetyltransferase [Eubacteriales bacterium]
MQSGITIRAMEAADAKRFSDAFAAQGWQKPEKQFLAYLSEQESGSRYCLSAEKDGEIAGYVTVLPRAAAGPFAQLSLPEISDFNVLIRFRRLGIGSALLSAAEEIAFRFSDTVTLGVGLHSGYGAAQRMYIKRGYVPDGSGVWYEDKPLLQNAICRNDDDLVLYLSRQR